MSDEWPDRIVLAEGRSGRPMVLWTDIVVGRYGGALPLVFGRHFRMLAGKSHPQDRPRYRLVLERVAP